MDDNEPYFWDSDLGCKNSNALRALYIEPSSRKFCCDQLSIMSNRYRYLSKNRETVWIPSAPAVLPGICPRGSGSASRQPEKSEPAPLAGKPWKKYSSKQVVRPGGVKGEELF